MADPVYPQINGNRYSWASIRINLAGKVFKGFKALNYKQGLEPGVIMGTSPQPLGRTRGDYKPEASIELWRAEYDALVIFFGDGFMEHEFGITASFSEPKSPIAKVNILGCRMKGIDHSYAISTDGLAVKVDLSVMAITENGLAPILGMQGVS